MSKKCAAFFVSFLAMLASSSRSQTINDVIDQFNPAGAGGENYAAGGISNIWSNWFGGAFQTLTWDSTSDASNNPDSGSMKITAVFSASSSQNQFEIFDGENGINPPASGAQYTNFQCDVRFASGSATTTNGGLVSFGHLQFGIITGSSSQDYFGGIDVPATNTNWVQVSVPLNVVTDSNLLQINDVLIHIYGPYYGTNSELDGVSTLWVDNIQFVGASLPPPGTNCLIDANNVHQRIDGFGASSAWRGSWTANQVNMFYSTNTGSGTSLDGTRNFSFTGIGLSLLRNHIVYASSTSSSATPGTAETGIMQMAQSLGARVWSTPWTPASGFKSNDGPDGGNYLGSGANATNRAYASQLANYVANMKNTYGINLYGLSVQNEPNAPVTTYEACTWTGSQIHDFVTNLYSALAAKGLSSTRIIIPESENWSGDPGLDTPTLNDSNVLADVGIIANHDYVANNVIGDTTIPAALSTSGPSSWETEVAQIGGTFDGSITNALYWAGRIHLYLTAAQINAWHYWWLISENDDNEGLTDTNGIPAKRMYALGQFARFVRPGYYRINVDNTDRSGSILVSAYKDSASPNFAIVAINTNNAPINESFALTNLATVNLVAPWITSGNLSLSAQPSVSVTNSSFTYSLPAMSIVTFTGQSMNNLPPVLSPVAGQTINPGVMLTITNVAADTNIPFPAFAFTALAAPTNASLNSSNGIFAWRPLTSQASTTNNIVIKVIANGAPGLAATNSFAVTVNPAGQPKVNSIEFSGNQVSLLVTGIQGPDYTLLASTNLLTWQILLTSNSPVLPLTWEDTHAADFSRRFYRVRIGP